MPYRGSPPSPGSPLPPTPGPAAASPRRRHGRAGPGPTCSSGCPDPCGFASPPRIPAPALQVCAAGPHLRQPPRSGLGKGARLGQGARSPSTRSRRGAERGGRSRGSPRPGLRRGGPGAAPPQLGERGEAAQGRAHRSHACHAAPGRPRSGSSSTKQRWERAQGKGRAPSRSPSPPPHFLLRSKQRERKEGEKKGKRRGAEGTHRSKRAGGGAACCAALCCAVPCRAVLPALPCPASRPACQPGRPRSPPRPLPSFPAPAPPLPSPSRPSLPAPPLPPLCARAVPTAPFSSIEPCTRRAPHCPFKAERPRGKPTEEGGGGGAHCDVGGDLTRRGRPAPASRQGGGASPAAFPPARREPGQGRGGWSRGPCRAGQGSSGVPGPSTALGRPEHLAGALLAVQLRGNPAPSSPSALPSGSLRARGARSGKCPVLPVSCLACGASVCFQTIPLRLLRCLHSPPDAAKPELSFSLRGTSVAGAEWAPRIHRYHSYWF